MEFCQEFFDDVPVPASAVVGEVDDGWTVASRLLVHERNAVGGASPYTSGRNPGRDETRADADLLAMVREAGLAADPHARQLLAEARIRQMVGAQLVRRVGRGMAAGTLPPPAGSLLKLYGATAVMRALRDRPGAGGPGRRRLARRGPTPRAAAWPRCRCGARACRWGAAATRCSATSSASGCWACPASPRPTATCPTGRSAVASAAAGAV